MHRMAGFRPAERLCGRLVAAVVFPAPPLWTRRAGVDRAVRSRKSAPKCAKVGHATPAGAPNRADPPDAVRDGDTPSPTSVPAPAATAIGARVAGWAQVKAATSGLPSTSRLFNRSVGRSVHSPVLPRAFFVRDWLALLSSAMLPRNRKNCPMLANHHARAHHSQTGNGVHNGL